MPMVRPAPQPQVRVLQSPALPSLTTYWATAAVPNRMRMNVPTSSPISSRVRGEVRDTVAPIGGGAGGSGGDGSGDRGDGRGGDLHVLLGRSRAHADRADEHAVAVDRDAAAEDDESARGLLEAVELGAGLHERHQRGRRSLHEDRG